MRERRHNLFGRVRFFLLGAIGLALVVELVGLQVVSAQSVNPDILKSLQQRGAIPGQDRNHDLDEDSSPSAPGTQSYQPVAPSQEPPPTYTPPPTSTIERAYATRAHKILRQFGYDFLGAPATVTIANAGAIQDDYILAPGDELSFTLRGQENASYRQKIDRDGRIILPKLAPVVAAGRRLADFRSELEARVAQSYVSTNIFVSLATVHQVSVLVTGSVRTPGARIVSALATPLDAILLSGGIEKDGSLRNIRVIRGGGERRIDLYSLITQGHAENLGNLRDGDRIFVPPIGSTVAVDGGVNRRGIFELPANTATINVRSLMQLAQGTPIAGTYRLTKETLQADGSVTLEPTTTSGFVRSGEILFVDAATSADLNRVSVQGAVNLENSRPLTEAKTTSDLFHGGDLASDGYGQFAVLIRRDSQTNSIQLVPFSVAAAISRRRPVPLKNGDIAFVFSSEEIQALARVVTKDADRAYGDTTTDRNSEDSSRGPSNSSSPSQSSSSTDAAALVSGANGNPPNQNSGNSFLSPTNGSPPNGSNTPAVGTTTSAVAAAVGESADIARRQRGELPEQRTRTDDGMIDDLAKRMAVPRQQLLRVAADNLVWVLDSVSLPGPYLLAPGSSLADAIDAAGQPLQTADLAAIEITSTKIDQQRGVSRTERNQVSAAAQDLALVMLNNLDVVRLRPVYSDREKGAVTVSGEVRFPGVFSILRDERLSSVLERAGGLTEVAYPFGAVFTRKAAAVAEREAHEQSARELESQIMSFATTASTTQPASADSLRYLEALTQQLRTAPVLGRVSVTADPTVLATNPQLDPVLQPGDAIYIPKRPMSVTVSGEVLNPGAFQFASNLSFDDYIDRAGGVTQSAYRGLSFVVLPDGSARPLSQDWLSVGGGGHIPPGSTIVVPRDLRPFDWGSFVKDATQIVSQLAVAAASLAIVGRN